MPTYQYACTACGEQLEKVQSFTDAALTDCPSCQGALRKVFSAVGVVFKGSGFYKTDSRSSGAEKKAVAPAASSESTSASTSAKPDSSTKSESSPKADSAPKASSPAA